MKKDNKNRIGRLAMYYGGIWVKEEDGKFYLGLDDYSGIGWEEISGELYNQLILHNKKLNLD